MSNLIIKDDQEVLINMSAYIENSDNIMLKIIKHKEWEILKQKCKLRNKLVPYDDDSAWIYSVIEDTEVSYDPKKIESYRILFGDKPYYGSCDIIYVLNLDLEHNLKKENIIGRLKTIMDNDDGDELFSESD